MSYFETSAKSDVGVTELMTHICKITYTNKKKNMPAEDPQNAPFPLDRVRHSEVGAKQHKAEAKKKGGCCK